MHNGCGCVSGVRNATALPLIHIWIGYCHYPDPEKDIFARTGRTTKSYMAEPQASGSVQLHPLDSFPTCSFVLVISSLLYAFFSAISSTSRGYDSPCCPPLMTTLGFLHRVAPPASPRCGQVSKRTRPPSLFFVNTHSLSIIVTFDSRKWRWPPPQATTTSFSLSRSPRKS